MVVYTGRDVNSVQYDINLYCYHYTTILFGIGLLGCVTNAFQDEHSPYYEQSSRSVRDILRYKLKLCVMHVGI